MSLSVVSYRQQNASLIDGQRMYVIGICDGELSPIYRRQNASRIDGWRVPEFVAIDIYFIMKRIGDKMRHG